MLARCKEHHGDRNMGQQSLSKTVLLYASLNLPEHLDSRTCAGTQHCSGEPTYCFAVMVTERTMITMVE